MAVAEQQQPVAVAASAEPTTNAPPIESTDVRGTHVDVIEVLKHGQVNAAAATTLNEINGNEAALYNRIKHIAIKDDTCAAATLDEEGVYRVTTNTSDHQQDQNDVDEEASIESVLEKFVAYRIIRMHIADILTSTSSTLNEDMHLYRGRYQYKKAMICGRIAHLAASSSTRMRLLIADEMDSCHIHVLTHSDEEMQAGYELVEGVFSREVLPGMQEGWRTRLFDEELVAVHAMMKGALNIMRHHLPLPHTLKEGDMVVVAGNLKQLDGDKQIGLISFYIEKVPASYRDLFYSLIDYSDFEMFA